VEDRNPMQNIESMEALVVEIKKETKSCRDNTLTKLDELYKVLTEDANSEETTASATAEAELGG
jgi:hypothetical protein